MKLFVKILGGICYGFVVVLLASLLLGSLVGTVYGIMWSHSTASLEHEMPVRWFVTGMCVIGFFTTLGITWLVLDDCIGFESLPSRPITPTSPQQKETPKPILGDLRSRN